MNKLFVLLFLICAVSFTLDAQSYGKPKAHDFAQKGRLDIQAVAGLVPTFSGARSRAVSLPFTIAADLMVSKKFSVGLYGGNSISESYPRLFVDGVPGQWRNNYTEAGARFAIHITTIEKFDFYGGINLGVRHSVVEDLLPGMEQLNIWKGIEPTKTSVAYGGFVGARYAISDRFSGFTEIGSGVSLVKIGAGFRLF